MSTRNDSDRIDEELVCVDSFVQRLKEIDSDQIITVCREYNDPLISGLPSQKVSMQLK